jgi:putative nucleotidyltransferase with HDIG domain
MANGRPRTTLKDVVVEGSRNLVNWRQYIYPVTLSVVVLVLGVMVAVLTNPVTTEPALPLSDDDVGKKAVSEIRAVVDFSVPDVEATERKRREAEEAELSVYDFDVELGAEKIRRLREAFAAMANVIKQHEELQAGQVESKKNGNGAKALPGKLPKNDGPPKDDTSSERFEELSLDAKLDTRKDYFVRTLQVILSEREFRTLKKDRFSSKTLAVVSKLVQETMQRMIVANRELLAAESSRGITVRVVREGVPYEQHEVRGFAKILDVKEAQKRLERTATLELREGSGALRTAQISLAKSLISPNLNLNQAEGERRKEEAREAIKLLEEPIKKKTVIIASGDLITKSHIRKFQEMKAEISRQRGDSDPLELALGSILLVVIMLVITSRFSMKNIRSLKPQPKDLLLLGLVLFIFIVTTKIWFWTFGAIWNRFQLFQLESYYYAIPFAAGAMLVRFVLSSEITISFTVVASVIAGLLMESNIGFTVYCLVSSLVAAWAVASAKQRSSLFKAGAITGSANTCLAIGLSLFQGDFWSVVTFYNAIFAFSGGILVAMIVTATAPLIEIVFGYTTDIKLLELANLNHPLLKDLIVQAPGSYHHSVIVGSLVETAAESINCNPLLARVMAYYHDIGKVKSPNYFSENLRDSNNPHDKLKPSLSATVLKTHVKDGAELARNSRLGEPIIEAIVQHHGTSLIKFFYQKAKDNEDPENPVKEEEFRYPGPKPQTREVALVMLADSVEAAAKSLSDPSPARLQGLVQNMINRIFSDGQLNECDLTLKDLNEIARSFNKVLAGIYHHRPDYPQAAIKERETSDRKAKGSDTKNSHKRDSSERRPEESEKKEEDLKRLGM